MRAIWFFIKVGLLVYAAVWIADRPGNVMIAWQGYEITTSIGVVILAVLFFAVTYSGLENLWRLLRSTADRLRGTAKERRMERGIAALTNGFIAVATGEADVAKLASRRAHKYLTHNPLNTVLAAQAAQLAGDTTKAKRCYQDMLLDEKTVQLGLRGLLQQALNDNDQTTAAGIVAEAAARNISSPWLLKVNFGMQTRAKNWDGALAILEKAKRKKVFDKKTADHHRGVIYLAKSREHMDLAEPEDALQMAEKAYGAEDSFAPVVQHYVSVLIDQDKQRKARSVLMKALKHHPHPLLEEVVDDYMMTLTPEKRTAFEKKVQEIHPRTDAGKKGRWVCDVSGVQSERWVMFSPVTGDFNTLAWQDNPATYQLSAAPGATRLTA